MTITLVHTQITLKISYGNRNGKKLNMNFDSVIFRTSSKNNSNFLL